MIIIVDKREQAPWTFEGLGVETRSAKLETGDYSIAGLEKRVTIERKSLSDWIKTVLHERRRFYKELDRMASFDFRCVIIEATTREILSEDRQYRSRANAKSLLGFMHQIQVAQSVPVLLGGSRAECQLHAHGFLQQAAKRLIQLDGSE